MAIEKCGNKFPSLPEVKHPDNTVTFEYVLIFDEEEKSLNQWIYSNNYKKIIFSHDFAKAFWGERKSCTCSDDYLIGAGVCHCRTNVGWKYHLQQMVLAEEPLKYLENFLDK